MATPKKRTLREMLYELREDSPEVLGTDGTLELDKEIRRKEQQLKTVQEWRKRNREWQNEYNRNRAHRLKWERRCGLKLKNLPIDGCKCDLCNARIPLGYQQPYKHGSVCAACVMVFRYFDDDPEKMRKAAAYHNLVTENWDYDSSKQRDRRRERDSKTGKFKRVSDQHTG